MKQSSSTAASHTLLNPARDSGGNVTWETSTVRSWLNGYSATSSREEEDYSNDNFFDRAFRSREQAAILSSTVANKNNPCFGTEGGKDTTDKVFSSLYSYAGTVNSEG